MFKNFPNFIQLDITDCGPTCIKIISKHYGKEFSNEYLRELSFKSRVGTSFLGLSECAEKLGFKTTGVRMTYPDFQEVVLPAIAFWKQEHFVVVYKANNNYIWISDPAVGLIKYSKKEFMDSWTGGDESGIVLLMEPTEYFFNSKNVESKTENNSFLVSNVKKHFVENKTLIIQLIIGIFLGSILQVSLPFLTQSIIDDGIMLKNINIIYMILIGQLFLFIGRVFIDILQKLILVHVNSKVNIYLLSEFLQKLLRLPLKYFDVKMSGDILQRIADHERLENFITRGFITFLISTINIVIFSIVLLYYSAPIFFIFLLFSSVFIFWITIFLKKRSVIDKLKFNELSSLNDKSIEIIQGMNELKLNNASVLKRWEWEHIQSKLFEFNLRGLNLEQIQQSGGYLINEIGSLIITFYSAKLVIEGDITLGIMLAISFIIGQLNSPVIQLINVINLYQDAKLSIERISEVHRKPEETNSNLSFANFNVQNDIELNNVGFSYNGKTDSKVLSGINLTFKKGTTTAIVGESGCGKTTLMKLLLKIYEPTEGNIFLGDRNYSEIAPDFLRANCGTVLQEGFLFNDSIVNNICLGADTIDKEKLMYACKTANILQFIESLPMKFGTKIGNNGVNLSTGQKQRIQIARALYRDPYFILFDEATSALDAKNEMEISDNLMDFYKGRTVIIIAHRLSTVINADTIVLIDKGTIVEQGSHIDLVKLRGKYYNLIKNQLDISK